MDLPVDNSMKFHLDSAYPKREGRGSDAQKVNKDGVPEWSVNALHRSSGQFGRTETLKVTVPSQVDPMDGLEPFELITFKNLHIHVGYGDRGAFVWFTADGVVKAR